MAVDLLQAGGKPPGLFHSAKNRKESAKNMAFWQWDRDFWHFGVGFWQITVVRIVGKPINRAFHGYLWNAKNFKFGRRRNVFGNVFGRGTKIFGIAVCESNQ